MIVLNILGKIERTLISKKLQIYVDNLPSDWKEGIKEDIYEEIRKIEFNRNNQEIKYGKIYQNKFDFVAAKKIVETNIRDIKNYSLDNLEGCIDCIVDNMIFIEFDYEYSNMPFWNWKTNAFDGRLCEEDYSEKIIKLLNFMMREEARSKNFNIIYSSNEENISTMPSIILALSLENYSDCNVDKTKQSAIYFLKQFGACIDDFIQVERDYYKFDFIAEAIAKEDNYKHYHFLRVFTVLEMLLLDRNQKTEEIEIYIRPILKRIYHEDAIQASRLLRQMRNKVGHGDFIGFNKKAYEFADVYMKYYNFDYTEYSRLNWILIHICCLLDDVLKEVIIQKFRVNQFLEL